MRFFGSGFWYGNQAGRQGCHRGCQPYCCWEGGQLPCIVSRSFDWGEGCEGGGGIVQGCWLVSRGESERSIQQLMLKEKSLSKSHGSTLYKNIFREEEGIVNYSSFAHHSRDFAPIVMHSCSVVAHSRLRLGTTSGFPRANPKEEDRLLLKRRTWFSHLLLRLFLLYTALLSVTVTRRLMCTPCGKKRREKED